MKRQISLYLAGPANVIITDERDAWASGHPSYQHFGIFLAPIPFNKMSSGTQTRHRYLGLFIVFTPGTLLPIRPEERNPRTVQYRAIA